MAIRNTPLKMGGQQIQGLGDAVEASDAVNKGQMDAAIAGVDLSLYAPLASPTFTGDPKAPTPATADNDTSIATTAYVQANLANYATLASPALTGNPTAPTPSTSDNDTSIATTAYVKANLAWTHIMKTADQSTTSASFADDNTLQFAVAANTSYVFRGVVSIDAGAGGFRLAVNGPAAPTEIRVNAGTSTVITAYDSGFAINAGSGVFQFSFQGKIENGATSGTLALRIRQDSASGTTTFEKGSWLEYRSI